MRLGLFASGWHPVPFTPVQCSRTALATLAVHTAWTTAGGRSSLAPATPLLLLVPGARVPLAQHGASPGHVGHSRNLPGVPLGTVLLRSNITSHRFLLNYLLRTVKMNFSRTP